MIIQLNNTFYIGTTSSNTAIITIPAADLQILTEITHTIIVNVNDLADACFLLMRQYDESEPINIGSGNDISITELVHIIMEEKSAEKTETIMNKLLP